MADAGKGLRGLLRGLRRGAPLAAATTAPSPAEQRGAAGGEPPAGPRAPDLKRVRLEEAAELRSGSVSSRQNRPGRPAHGDPVQPSAGVGAARLPGSNPTMEGIETPEERARRKFRKRVDEAIAEAEERGDFANLKGKGKPIPAELLVSADDAWLAGKTLSNGGFLPPWLQLQHEIDHDLAECRRLVERCERFPPLANRERPLAELRQRLDDVRAKARRYNLLVPSMELQRPLPKSDELVQRMAAAASLPLEGDAAAQVADQGGPRKG